MADVNVLEVGPGVRPVRYAYDADFNYLGIDPDMHYLVDSGFAGLINKVESRRVDMSGFEFRNGVVLSDHLGKLACTQDIVIMANVLGDSATYRGEYSGLFVDPESGKTRRTDIQSPGQLVAQALQCLKPGGTLTVIEDAVIYGNIGDHKTSGEFEEILNQDEVCKNLISQLELFTGEDYVEIVTDLYPELMLDELSSEYLASCFAASCHTTIS